MISAPNQTIGMPDPTETKTQPEHTCAQNAESSNVSSEETKINEESSFTYKTNVFNARDINERATQNEIEELQSESLSLAVGSLCVMLETDQWKLSTDARKNIISVLPSTNKRPRPSKYNFPTDLPKDKSTKLSYKTFLPRNNPKWKPTKEATEKRESGVNNAWTGIINARPITKPKKRHRKTNDDSNWVPDDDERRELLKLGLQLNHPEEIDRKSLLRDRLENFSKSKNIELNFKSNTESARNSETTIKEMMDKPIKKRKKKKRKKKKTSSTKRKKKTTSNTTNPATTTSSIPNDRPQLPPPPLLSTVPTSAFATTPNTNPSKQEISSDSDVIITHAIVKTPPPPVLQADVNSNEKERGRKRRLSGDEETKVEDTKERSKKRLKTSPKKAPTMKTGSRASSKMKQLDSRLTCKKCRIHFESRAELTIHRTTKHPQKSPIKSCEQKCTKCDIVFDSKKSWEEHCRSSDHKFTCVLCIGCVFETADEMASHLKTAHGPSSYGCAFCSKKFKIEENRNSHQLECMKIHCPALYASTKSTESTKKSTKSKRESEKKEEKHPKKRVSAPRKRTRTTARKSCGALVKSPPKSRKRKRGDESLENDSTENRDSQAVEPSMKRRRVRDESNVGGEGLDGNVLSEEAPRFFPDFDPVALGLPTQDMMAGTSQMMPPPGSMSQMSSMGPIMSGMPPNGISQPMFGYDGSTGQYFPNAVNPAINPFSQGNWNGENPNCQSGFYPY